MTEIRQGLSQCIHQHLCLLCTAIHTDTATQQIKSQSLAN